MWSNLFFWSWFLSFQIVSHPLYLLPQFKEDWKEKVFPLMDFFFTLFEQMWTKDKCTFCADVETFIHTTFFLRQHMARIFQGFSHFFCCFSMKHRKWFWKKFFDQVLKFSSLRFSFFSHFEVVNDEVHYANCWNVFHPPDLHLMQPPSGKWKVHF